jgi:hypothetical protein
VKAIELTRAVLVIYLDRHTRENAMIKALIFAAGALALSAISASADGYRYGYGRHYGYHYGYASPVFEYEAGAYYGYPAPSYIHTPAPIYAAAPVYVAPVVSTPAYGYGSGSWGGSGYGGGYGYGWR